MLNLKYTNISVSGLYATFYFPNYSTNKSSRAITNHIHTILKNLFNNKYIH